MKKNSIARFSSPRDGFVKHPARNLAWAQRVAALGILLFWVAFFHDHSDVPANVADFEWCFLVPDLLWIAGAFLFASHWLIIGHARAAIATAVGGSALVYLGLLDIACNLRHGQYSGSLSRGVLNVGVNALCVLFGLFNIWYASRPDKQQAIS